MAHNFIALQDKFVSDEFVFKVEGVPTDDLMPRSAELVAQFMTMFFQAFVDKDIEDLGKAKEKVEEKVKLLESRVGKLVHDLENEKEVRKKQYGQTISNYIYTTLSKLPNFDFKILGAEVVEIADGFC
uniref:Uncharacterized protein n=1 Tax=Cannabis sativa TaxID=3483 RepID=A0A803Q7M3_CANSA